MPPLTDNHIDIERLLDAISSVVIFVDDAGDVRHWNQMAQTTFGIPAATVTAKPFLDCGIRWDWEAVRKALAACRAAGGAPQRTELKFSDARRRDRIFGMTLSGTDADSSFVLIGMDITEKINLENELRQAQKLESVGQLASAIAHEINTPIQFVGDNTRFITEAFADVCRVLEAYGQLGTALTVGTEPAAALAAAQQAAAQADVQYLLEEIPRALEQTLEGVTRVTNIVRAMKEFARPDSTEKTPADLNHALETTLVVAHGELKYFADIETDLAADLPQVVCHEGRMKQVFLNLLVNAAQAIEDQVKAGRQERGKIIVKSRRDGDDVVITVSDTGGGIPPEIRGRIFDPFFTTKEVGRGSGQGLPIARSVVCERHGGTLTFATRLGEGTTFIVRLPTGQSRAAAAPSEEGP